MVVEYYIIFTNQKTKEYEGRIAGFKTKKDALESAKANKTILEECGKKVKYEIIKDEYNPYYGL